MMIFKNMFSFGLTFHGYEYIQQSGPRKIFTAIGAVQVVICLLAIPMYVFGKRHRAWWGRREERGGLWGMVGLK